MFAHCCGHQGPVETENLLPICGLGMAAVDLCIFCCLGFSFGFLPFLLVPASRNTALVIGKRISGLGGLMGPCCPQLPRKGRSAPYWWSGRKL